MILAVSVTSILGLIVGIVFGIVIVFFIYMLLILKTIEDESNDLSNDEYDKITEYTNSILSAYKKNKKNEIAKIIQDMIDYVNIVTRDVSKMLYPDSSNPLLELSVKKTLDLSLNISKRVNELLNKRTLKILKRLKISQIIQVSLLKKKIDNNLLLRFNKKFKITDKFSFLKGILNFINPVYWIKKIIMDLVIVVILNKIVQRVIVITAQETFKAYK